jgi:hypothetical protein
MINYILLAIFIALQCGDFYTTYTILKTGKGYEANPILKWVFDKIGYVTGLVIFKCLAVAVGVYAAQFWNGYYVLIPMVALYTWVVWNNFNVLKGKK